jgi:hypothetical protein
MKDRALEKGATHYSHVCYPMTGLTAAICVHSTGARGGNKGDIFAVQTICPNVRTKSGQGGAWPDTLTTSFDGALSWRFQRARGGNGVLGDLASHGVDLVRYLLGEVESVFADTAIFISQRPVPTGATSGHQLASGGHRDEVENEEYVVAQVRLASGARCALEASRVSVGEQNAYGFEIHGTSGTGPRTPQRNAGASCGSGVRASGSVLSGMVAMGLSLIWQAYLLRH